MRRIDAIHLGLMCSALGLTYLVPFELLLLAYVVLGPAHYLTEISWLHDRKYFLPHYSLPIILAVVGVGAAFVTDGYWFGVLFWITFVTCVLFAATTTAAQSLAVIAAAAALSVVLAQDASTFLILGTLLPTLVHVSLFTLVFMVLGAWRAGSKAQFVLVAVYLASIALILLLPPSAATVVPKFAEIGREYFGGVAPAIGRVFGVPDLTLDARFTGLLAFVYVYHYLNWFIKAEIIRWADVPRARLALIAGASIGSTALYFYDYALGFFVLLGMSLLHVVLEFPLNSLAVKQLGTLVGHAVMKTGLVSRFRSS